MRALWPVFGPLLLLVALGGVVWLAAGTLDEAPRQQLLDAKFEGLWRLLLDTNASIWAVLLLLLAVPLRQVWKALGELVTSRISALVSGPRPTLLGAEGLGQVYQEIAAVIDRRYAARKPFAFFFDDLDRCTPERIADFIEAIHSLTAAGCVTFVACDEAYVAAALNARHEAIVRHHEAASEFGRKFLEKIVQLPFRLPAIEEADLYELGLLSRRSALSHTLLGDDGAARPTPAVTAGPDGDEASPVTATDRLPEAELSARQRRQIAQALVGGLTVPLELTTQQRDDLVALIDRAIDAARPDGPETARRIAAFVAAEREDPDWLAAFVDDVTAPATGRIAGNDDAREVLAAALGNDHAALRALDARIALRLSTVLSELLDGAVVALGLNVRQVKSLSNLIKLYVRLANAVTADEARRIAAFVLADQLDPRWLDGRLRRVDVAVGPIGQLAGDADALPERLAAQIGEDDETLRRLYRLVGRRPKMVADLENG